MTNHQASADNILDWYAPGPQEAADQPGTLIRREPLTGRVPADASAWKILYWSKGLHHEPIVVSALLIIPAGPPPPDGRPILAWAHPATGVERYCAPSLLADGLATIMGLERLLRQGYVVVATDYPGLGTPGPHPFLVGESEGRAVVDAVRAARNFPQAHAGDRFAVWGHSQGGHAALHAAMLAHDYAPELHLLGVAAAAPATDMQALTPDMGEDRILASMLLASWSQVYGIPIDRLVAADEEPKVMQLARVCLDPARDAPAQPPPQTFPQVSYRMIGTLATTEPWKSIAATNSTRVPPADVPVFLAAGTADTVIPQAATVRYMQQLCRAGVRVHLEVVQGATHHLVGRDCAAAAVEWIGGRFAGNPAPDDCHPHP